MPIVSKIKVGDATWLRDNSKGTKEPFVKAEVINSQQGGKRITAKNSKTGEEVKWLAARVPGTRTCRRSGRLTPAGRPAHRQRAEPVRALAAAREDPRCPRSALPSVLTSGRTPRAGDLRPVVGRHLSGQSGRPVRARPLRAHPPQRAVRARELSRVRRDRPAWPGAQGTGAEGAHEARRRSRVAWDVAAAAPLSIPLQNSRLDGCCAASPFPEAGVPRRRRGGASRRLTLAAPPLLSLVAGATWRTRSTRTPARSSSRSTPSAVCPSTGAAAARASPAARNPLRAPAPAPRCAARSLSAISPALGLERDPMAP